MLTGNPARLAVATALAVVFAMVPGSAQPKAAGPTATEIAARVQAFYDKTRTFSARFQQTYRLALRNKTKKDSGQVYFEKPGKMSWRYPGTGNRVVSDGKTIWVYEPANKQVIVQKMTQSSYPAALSFLMGGGKLDQSLDLSLSKMPFAGGYVLLGKPKTPTPAYEQVYLYVDAKTYHVRRVVLFDGQRNRNQFDFSAPKANLPAPPGEFTFKIPSGVTLVQP